MNEAERRRAIGVALSRLEGSPVAGIPSGCLSLDWALGGGYPRGRMVEIFGSEASGKTTLALAAAAAAQKAGGTAAYIDAEHALDTAWAHTVGVDVGTLLLSQPDSGEQALEIAGALVGSGAVDLVVVDSVAALVPRIELSGEMGGVQAGFQERLMSQAMRRLAPAAARSQTCLIFLNQIRGTAGRRYGAPETTAGGISLKTHASLRVEVRRTGQGGCGSRVHARVVKNKLAPPFREAAFEILFSEGISREADLLELAAAHGVPGPPAGEGREAARLWLKRHAEAREALEIELRKRLGLPGGTPG